jgi:hypothetical protein
MGKGNAMVDSTSNWKEKALLVEDPAHATLATDPTQSSLIQRFYHCFMLMVNSCGHKAWFYLGYRVFCWIYNRKDSPAYISPVLSNFQPKIQNYKTSSMPAGVRGGISLVHYFSLMFTLLGNFVLHFWKL